VLFCLVIVFDKARYDPIRHAGIVWGRLWVHCVRQWEANTPLGLHVDVETGLSDC
jgi:hypothetical protein